MRFKTYTLIDITQTRARRGEDRLLLSEQQNYLTFLQTLALRVNPDIPDSPLIETVDVKGLGFGSEYKGKHCVWSFEFDIPYEAALTVEMLEEDFELVPVITDLNETARIKDPVFVSKNPKLSNVVFGIVDK
tara:strand:- start:86 stop:481 length:396 start_codon:yes stop_codon:yes gene_type:complete